MRPRPEARPRIGGGGGGRGPRLGKARCDAEPGNAEPRPLLPDAARCAPWRAPEPLQAEEGPGGARACMRRARGLACRPEGTSQRGPWAACRVMAARLGAALQTARPDARMGWSAPNTLCSVATAAGTSDRRTCPRAEPRRADGAGPRVCGCGGVRAGTRRACRVGCRMVGAG